MVMFLKMLFDSYLCIIEKMHLQRWYYQFWKSVKNFKIQFTELWSIFILSLFNWQMIHVEEKQSLFLQERHWKSLIYNNSWTKW